MLALRREFDLRLKPKLQISAPRLARMLPELQGFAGDLVATQFNERSTLVVRADAMEF